MNFRNFIFLLFLNILFSCDNNNTSEVDFRCCTDEINENVNNLNKVDANIMIGNVITPNGDGVNDAVFISDLNLYPNNRFTVFDLNNIEVFHTEGYGLNGNIFTGEDLSEGSYIYKLVIENEETFLLQGYLCIVKSINNSFPGGLGCRPLTPDPIL